MREIPSRLLPWRRLTDRLSTPVPFFIVVVERCSPPLGRKKMGKAASYYAAVLLLFVAVIQGQTRPEDDGLKPIKEVEMLLFRSDTMTDTVPNHPQLMCTGDCPDNLENEAACYYQGINDMGAAVWQCRLVVTENSSIRQTKLICKGKIRSNGQYVIPGTCRMTYDATKKAAKWNFDRASACMDTIGMAAKALTTLKNSGSVFTELKKADRSGRLRKYAKRAITGYGTANTLWQCVGGQQSEELREVSTYVVSTLE